MGNKGGPIPGDDKAGPGWASRPRSPESRSGGPARPLSSAGAGGQAHMRTSPSVQFPARLSVTHLRGPHLRALPTREGTKAWRDEAGLCRRHHGDLGRCFPPRRHGPALERRHQRVREPGACTWAWRGAGPGVGLGPRVPDALTRPGACWPAVSRGRAPSGAASPAWFSEMGVC